MDAARLKCVADRVANFVGREYNKPKDNQEYYSKNETDRPRAAAILRAASEIPPPQREVVIDKPKAAEDQKPKRTLGDFASRLTKDI